MSKREDDYHAKNPKPGDYWNEMFSPVCVVMTVTDAHVKVCREIKKNSKGAWWWNFTKVQKMTRAEFVELLRYEAIPGYYATCFPEAHLDDFELKN